MQEKEVVQSQVSEINNSWSRKISSPKDSHNNNKDQRLLE